MADIPGLIEGAHEGRGIGDRFLGHVERSAALLHLVDGTSETVAADHDLILAELAAYDPALAAKPRVTALNKVDALEPEILKERLAALTEAAGGDVLPMSGVSGEGVENVLRALRRLIDAKAEAAVQKEATPWTP